MIRGIQNNGFFKAPGLIESQKKQQPQASFVNTLRDMVMDVNNMQVESKQVNEAFIRGDIEDLHQVTIAAERAKIGMELLMEIRNKLLEGYQELMRMPI